MANGVIQSVREMPVSLTNNTASITFSNDDVRSRSANCQCGWLQHQEGSPLYQILDGGYYEVNFNANVSSATAGVVALALYQDGIIVPRNNSCKYNSNSGRCRKPCIY